MTLCDAVNDFRGKITTDSRDTRYCTFAPPEETVGVIDLSPGADGSRGIAFLADRMIVKLGPDAQQVYYRSIRVTETIPSYETPFEDELVIASPGVTIRISDCGLNKFFLRQLINTLCRMSVNMRDADREELEAQLTAEALDYYAAQQSPKASGTAVQTVPATQVAPAAQDAPVTSAEQEAGEKKREAVMAGVSPSAAAAVQEIAAAKRAARQELPQHIEITEEKIQWLSGKHEPVTASAPNSPEPQDITPDDLEDMTHEQTMNYLLDSIAEINSDEAPEVPAEEVTPAVQPVSEQPEPAPEPPVELPELAKPEPESNEPEHSEHEKPKLTHEPESSDIYIKASRRIRELCEDGRLTMEQINTAVREQLVEASEIYSRLDIGSAELPPAVKSHALGLASAAERLPEYFALGEDVAARVMFFMLYQMLSYTDRVLQTDESKRRLNYFFVTFGGAGIILSMLDAGEA